MHVRAGPDWQAETRRHWEYREESAAARAPEGCPIKGNIAGDGGRIYRTPCSPWLPWYDGPKIDESAGERWFCDEGEAVEAGWRAAKWR